jgi:NAD(P)-dependent dehydrogenase (short-subunit alcohol dehydrogenase family)
MNSNFNGKRGFVVGGSSGIGLETARLVLRGGGSAVITGQRKNKTEAARALLSQLGSVEALSLNLAQPAELAQLLATLDSQYQDIDLLVNSAGLFVPKAFLEHTEADYDQYLALNRATFLSLSVLQPTWWPQDARVQW